MAFSLGAVTAYLKADIGNFKQGIDSAKKQLSGFKEQLRDASANLNGLAIAAGAAFVVITRGMGDVIKQANIYQGAMTGLSSVARAFGESQDEATKAAESLAADGLMPVSDAATALKNLLAAGFGLDQAIELVNRFKDSAAFGRQGSLQFGEAVRSATEGIKNGNSILVDNAGVTKNLSMILEEAGYSAQDLMKATSDAGVRQAIFNGILKETTPQLGDTQRLADSAAGAQARFAAKVLSAKQAIGTSLQPILQGLLGALQPLLEMIPRFGDQIAAAAAAITVMIGAFLGLIAVIKVFMLFSSPLMIVFFAIAALVGVVIYKAFQKFQDQMKATAGATKKGMGDISGAAKKDLGTVSKLSKETVERLAEIDRQMNLTTKHFMEDLSDMIKGHQAKVAELKGQIAEENADFVETQDERKKKNVETLSDMEKEHAEKTNSLMQDIDREVSKGRKADLEKIAALREALAQENAEYDQQKAKVQADFEETTRKEKEEHDKRTAALQAKLDGETAILSRHEADVAAVRDIAMKDEITKLKDSYAEKMEQYELDKQEAMKADKEKSASAMAANASIGSSAVDAANQAKGAFEGLGNIDMTPMGATLGSDMAAAFKQAIMDGIKDIFTKDLPNMAGAFSDWFGKVSGADALGAKVSKGLGDLTREGGLLSFLGVRGFADGVRSFSGGLAMVGEEGPELAYLPKGTNVYSNSESKGMLTSGLGGQTTVENHYAVTISAGAFMGTPGDARSFAAMLHGEMQNLEIIKGKA